MKEVKVEKSKLQLTMEHIRKHSPTGKLIKLGELSMEPLSLEEEEVIQFIDALNNNEEYSDIKVLKGTADTYYYSSKGMTESYAKIAARIEDKDIPKTIAEMVRNESKLYPMATYMRSFYGNPFHYSMEEVAEALNKIKSTEEYMDIMETKASNGVPFLYSSKYLSHDHATGLAEYVEVVQKETP